MKWYFLDTGVNTGSRNMEIDRLLARICGTEEAYFRLYGWKPFCISLGANQDIEKVNSTKAAHDGIDIVFRPTGGRAILHSEEMTYSVILPANLVKSAKTAYREINIALVKGLKKYDSRFTDIELEKEQPDFPALYKTEGGNICFTAPAKSELKYKGKKIAGSAQRKMDRVILQHGSILCGTFHRNITSYLLLSDEEKNAADTEMMNKTTEIETVLGSETSYSKLALALLAGFEQHFNTEFELTDYPELLSSMEEKPGIQ